MKLKKAIEILSRVTKDYELLRDPDLTAALNLGIEALKRVKLHRTDRRYPFNTLLPGETED